MQRVAEEQIYNQEIIRAEMPSFSLEALQQTLEKTKSAIRDLKNDLRANKVLSMTGARLIKGELIRLKEERAAFYGQIEVLGGSVERHRPRIQFLEEILFSIFGQLVSFPEGSSPSEKLQAIKDLASLGLVCKQWHRVTSDNILWKAFLPLVGDQLPPSEISVKSYVKARICNAWEREFEKGGCSLQKMVGVSSQIAPVKVEGLRGQWWVFASIGEPDAEYIDRLPSLTVWNSSKEESSIITLDGKPKAFVTLAVEKGLNSAAVLLSNGAVSVFSPAMEFVAKQPPPSLQGQMTHGLSLNCYTILDTSEGKILAYITSWSERGVAPRMTAQGHPSRVTLGRIGEGRTVITLLNLSTYAKQEREIACGRPYDDLFFCTIERKQWIGLLTNGNLEFIDPLDSPSEKEGGTSLKLSLEPSISCIYVIRKKEGDLFMVGHSSHKDPKERRALHSVGIKIFDPSANRYVGVIDDIAHSELRIGSLSTYIVGTKVYVVRGLFSGIQIRSLGEDRWVTLQTGSHLEYAGFVKGDSLFLASKNGSIVEFWRIAQSGELSPTLLYSCERQPSTRLRFVGDHLLMHGGALGETEIISFDIFNPGKAS